MRITKDWLPLYGVWELLLFKRGNLPTANLTLLKINNLGVICAVKIQTVLFFLEYLSSRTLCHPHLQVAICYIFPECLLNKSFVSSGDVKLLYFKKMKWNVTNWFCNAFYCDCLWLLASLIRARCSVVLIWRRTDCNIWYWETRILIFIMWEARWWWCKLQVFQCLCFMSIMLSFYVHLHWVLGRV